MLLYFLYYTSLYSNLSVNSVELCHSEFCPC
uniref:Uncharacterized protein n=1 Tax=Anguilla anguilla TaxID=7936 RepID=A0A0E9RBE4_ANGAN